MHIIWIFLTILCSSNLASNSKKQNPISQTYPKTDFRFPLDLKPALAGSFGEIRSNHFHSGLDFKTNQREGYPVYAVADGYISRIRVQAGGFGNALYIVHPNGYTSVYGHLQRFNTRILQTVKTYQYRKESFEMDISLLFIELPVKKGEIIAWSGNSGGSGGPHLHFEIRDTQTEETINPQLFGLQLADYVKPTINGVYLYRLNGESFSGNTAKQYLKVSGSAGKYYLKPGQTITAGGQIGLGISTYDKNSASTNFNGVYSIELMMDGQSIYTSVWERFFFNHSRAVNAHIDYPAFITSGIRIQKSFVEPGNPLTLYSYLQNKGLVNVNDDKIHSFLYIVKDIAGNASTLPFNIKFNLKTVPISVKKAGLNNFSYTQVNNYSNGVVKVSIPAGALYSDIDFTYFSSPKPMGAFSAIHHIHSKLIPLQSGYSLCIKPDSTLSVNMQPKALIVDSRGISQGGEYEDGYVKTNSLNFGSFYVKLDTTSPKIIPINISEGKSLTGVSNMVFKISDNLSGIRTFTGTIDGQWILMEYDQKTATLWHHFDDHTLPGKHAFKLVVTDMKSNSKIYNVNFYR